MPSRVKRLQIATRVRRRAAARRTFLARAGTLALGAALPAAAIASVDREPQRRVDAWSAGSDAPERTEVKVGFMPLTDCASLVAAAALGFDRKYGISIRLAREPTWAAIRDKLISGSLDAAQLLYGMVYDVQLGIGAVRHDMAVLMTLNHNGQGITFSNRLCSTGEDSVAVLRRVCEHTMDAALLAHTFPTGTHAMWLYYWLAAHDIHPLRDVRTITVPPPRMVDRLQRGEIIGCCVGEPWNALAIAEGTGFSAATSQQVWPDHPEKALAAPRDFVQRHPNTARALIMAVLDASRHIEAMADRAALAHLLSREEYIGIPAEVIAPRLLGRYDDGRGRRWHDARALKFHDEGRVNFPYLSDGMWFMTQHRRWGLLGRDPDYAGVAQQVHHCELYREAASRLGVALPSTAMRTSRLIDGVTWDGREPAAYAQAFDVKAA